MTYDNSLAALQQTVAQKPQLEAKLKALNEQRREYDKQVLWLRISHREELADLEKLESRSLANYFYQVIGKLDDKLDKERREVYAAKVKLDAAQHELDGIQEDIRQLQAQLAQIRGVEMEYEKLLHQKQEALRLSGTPAATQLLELEKKIAHLKAQKQEIREAISAGLSAQGTADRILSELDSADGWNTWDMLGGGGIITHMAKHGHLDDAQDLVQELQSKLRRFQTELADIRIQADMQVNIDGFLRFADYFFDGLFADWAVADRISRSQDAVQRTQKQIGQMIAKLRNMEASADREIAQMQAQIEKIIATA